MDGLLDTAPCGFLTFLDDGTVEQANTTLLQILGYASDEIVGRHVESILTIGGRIFYHTHWFPLLRLHGSAEEIFLLFRRGDGQDVGMLVNAARRERDGMVYYDCVLMRVQERQKYEEQLLRARRTADAARAEAQEQSRQLKELNDQLEEQALELELQQQQLRDQALALEAASEELRVVNEDLLLRNEEAEALRVAAEAANEAKSSVLTMMSHELRTPLNAIAGYVQLIEMGIHGPVTEAQLEALARIASGQRYLLRLINDVLNLARIESGQMEYHIEDAAVGELVEAVLPMVAPQLSQKGLSLEKQVRADLRVRVDREKVQQIVLNLLGNAVKFTPAGRVTISTSVSLDPAAAVLLQVSDTGRGIPEDRLSTVFEPFVRVEEGRERKIEGSGMGLAISRDLARGMGGNLTAASRPGEGSTFTLHLPRA